MKPPSRLAGCLGLALLAAAGLLLGSLALAAALLCEAALKNWSHP